MSATIIKFPRKELPPILKQRIQEISRHNPLTPLPEHGDTEGWEAYHRSQSRERMIYEVRMDDRDLAYCEAAAIVDEALIEASVEDVLGYMLTDEVKGG